MLFLAGEYPPRPGGVGDYTALLAAHLAEQGVRVTVLASRDASAPPPPQFWGESRETAPPTPHFWGGQDRAMRAALHAAGRAELRASRTQYPALRRALLPVLRQTCPSMARSAPHARRLPVRVWRAVERWDWRCASVVLAAVRAARPDVVHVQYQPAAFGMQAAVSWLPGWLRRRCPSVRTLTTFHDRRVPYLFPKAGPFRAAVRDRLLLGSDAAIFTDLADWAAAAAVRPAGRHWVPIGSNLAPAPPPGYDRDAWRHTVGADAATFLIAHLGILNRSKGLETLFAALRRLHGQGRRVRLLLIGAEAGASDPSNRAYAAEVDRLLADPALANLVHRLPLLPPDQASGYLLAADAAAFPFVDGASLRRGSLLAALGHGLPTVSTGVGGWGLGDRGRGAVGLDDENLALVPPGDADALAGALARLADDAAARARLAAGGRSLVDALGWPRIAAAHRAIYTMVLDSD